MQQTLFGEENFFMMDEYLKKKKMNSKLHDEK